LKGINKDFISLNLIMLLNSFLPLVVRNIGLPSVEIVFYRTLMACFLLAIFMKFRKIDFTISKKDIARMLLSGFLTSTYSILLFVSAKISTLSVCLVGMATSSIWISILQPIFFRTKNQPLQELLGINAVIGLYIIFNSGFEYGWGLTVGISASFFGALLTIISSRLAKQYNNYQVTFYQMAGAWIGTTLFLPIYSHYFTKGQGLKLLSVTSIDLLLILGIAFVFSVYAYTVLLRCMKTIPPFVVALVANLSPIYGIIFDLVYKGKDEMMTSGFYLGASLLLGSVVAYPIFMHFMRKHEEKLQILDQVRINKEKEGNWVIGGERMID
jgi:drug/metabolite transporter (DMT)-like permease